MPTLGSNNKHEWKSRSYFVFVSVFNRREKIKKAKKQNSDKKLLKKNERTTKNRQRDGRVCPYKTRKECACVENISLDNDARCVHGRSSYCCVLQHKSMFNSQTSMPYVIHIIDSTMKATDDNTISAWKNENEKKQPTHNYNNLGKRANETHTRREKTHFARRHFRVINVKYCWCFYDTVLTIQ